jgi:hypothetical protein
LARVNPFAIIGTVDGVSKTEFWLVGGPGLVPVLGDSGASVFSSDKYHGISFGKTMVNGLDYATMYPWSKIVSKIPTITPDSWP